MKLSVSLPSKNNLSGLISLLVQCVFQPSTRLPHSSGLSLSVSVHRTASTGSVSMSASVCQWPRHHVGCSWSIEALCPYSRHIPTAPHAPPSPRSQPVPEVDTGLPRRRADCTHFDLPVTVRAFPLNTALLSFVSARSTVTSHNVMIRR